MDRYRLISPITGGLRLHITLQAFTWHECVSRHLAVLEFFKNAGGVQCLKNDDIGYRQGNIYSCNDPDLSACCEMDGQFTCCEPNYVKNTREQFKLWGSICVFVLVIVGVYTCLHRDVQWISGQTIQESLGINKKDRVEHESSIPLTNGQSGEKT